PVPRSLRGRMHVRAALGGAARSEVLREAAVFVPALEGAPRVELEARAAGAAVASPNGRDLQPELAAAETAGLGDHPAVRATRANEGLELARAQSYDALADVVTDVYETISRRRRPPSATRAPLEDRDWIVVDLHMHTNWSHDCSIEVDELLDHAEAE